jgi:hypothetical protein
MGKRYVLYVPLFPYSLGTDMLAQRYQFIYTYIHLVIEKLNIGHICELHRAYVIAVTTDAHFCFFI